MSLLSQKDKDSICQAVKLVTDTFMTTDVEYFMEVGSLDIWQEDKADTKFVRAILKCLVEYEKDEIKESVQGNEETQTLVLTMNVEDLKSRELIDSSDIPKLKAETDYFRLKNISYKVTDVYFDGPLDSQNILLIVKGRVFKDTVMLSNVVDYGN